jgi:branched-chain amino acid transport system substrate-binding protein
MRRILFSVFLILIVIVSACGKEKNEDKKKDLKVAVALPMDQEWATHALQGIQLALQGNSDIELVTYDTAGYSSDLEAQAAQQAISDSHVIAYIGMASSGQARVAIPLLNEANLAAISLTATSPGLTKAGFGENEPGIYYPTGRRNFFRLVPSDEVQGAVAAAWAKEMGVNTVVLVDDNSSYGTIVTGVFEVSAQDEEMAIAGHEHFDPETATDQDYTDLAAQILALNPDMVYIGGYVDGGVPQLIRELRLADSDVMIMGTDGIVLQNVLLDGMTADQVEGVYATDVAAPAEHLGTQEATDFVTAYQAAYTQAPITNSVLGYEAMKALLHVIDHTDNPTRGNIVNGLSNMSDFTSLFGTWQFNANGDISVNQISVWQLQAGEWQFVQIAQ